MTLAEVQRPASDVARLIEAMRDFLHLPSADHVLFALAIAVSSRLDGDPVWGLVVGAPSSGKTEALRTLDDVADEHLGELTAPGLLSWTPGKRARETGLLARCGSRPFATIGDLSTMLAGSDRGQREMLYALLRRAADGEVVRELGSAPEPLRWRGRLTLLAAVTPAIDRFSSHTDALGPRWLYFRLPESDTATRRSSSRAARDNAPQLAEHRLRARMLAKQVVASAVPRAHEARVPEAMAEALDDAALVAGLGRGVVERDGYGRREIVSLPVVEEPTRLAGHLALLARSLLGLGLPVEEVVRLARTSALDSIPQARRKALVALSSGEELTAAEIARRAGGDRKVIRFALEELAALGVARHRGDDQDDEEVTRTPKPWRLDGPDASLVADVVRRDVGGTKRGNPTPNPPKREDHTLRRTSEGTVNGSSHSARTAE